MSTRAQLTALLATKVLSGGSDTTAAGLRDYEQDAIDSNVNKTDDANVANGYAGLDSNGKLAADQMPFNTGASAQDGTGLKFVFEVTHGLGRTPAAVFITAKSTDASTDLWVSAIDGTKFAITFKAAPPGGTGNVVFFWLAI